RRPVHRGQGGHRRVRDRRPALEGGGDRVGQPLCGPVRPRHRGRGPPDARRGLTLSSMGGRSVSRSAAPPLTAVTFCGCAALYTMAGLVSWVGPDGGQHDGVCMAGPMIGDMPTAEQPALTPAIATAQKGDEEAFRHLYRTLQPLLLRYLQTLVGTDAEDVAGEAWLQISRDLRTFKGDWDAFRGWTVTIAR